MAPAPATAPPAAAASTVGVEDDGARGQNSLVVAKSEDVSMGGVKDDADLSAPSSSEPSSGVEGAPEPVDYKGGDTTECSSSFGDTCSGFDDEAEGGEAEVSSQAPAPADGDHASMLPRRKKVTPEWRNVIRPIMWRCQWLELRMKDLSSQVSRYDRELAQIEKDKELQQEVSKENGSMPDVKLIGKDQRNRSMKRRERKRHEDIADTSLYINKHQILSYYNDKQSKGAETDGHLLDDDCSPGGLDTVALLDAEEYDVIFGQVTLNDILSTIDGVQSQVHVLQDRLKKAHLEEDNLAFSEDNTHVRVPRKRQSTRKFCDTTYNSQSTKSQKHRNGRPQKRKNLNILLKDDDVPALAVKPAFPDRGTNYQIEDPKGSAGESGESNHSQDRAITVDLLLGVDKSLPNGHMGDFCKEDADDILIDNRTANEGSPEFEKIEHLRSETSSNEQNTSPPVEVEVMNTSAPVEVMNIAAPIKVDGISTPLNVDNSSPTLVNQDLLPMLKPVKKRGWKPKERNKDWGSASSSMNHSKGAYTTSDSEQKSKGVPPSGMEKTDESEPTAAMDLEILTPLSALKKRKAGNKSASAEERKAGKKSASVEEPKAGNLASKKQKTGRSAGNKSAAAEVKKSGNLTSKNAKMGKSSSGTRKQKAENPPPAAKKLDKTPAPKTGCTTRSKLRVEKAVLVAVNSRRSQRVRKPKVY